MNQVDVYQAKDVLMQSIGLMAYEDRDTLIALLRKNGVQLSDDVSNDELLNMTYVAVAKSLQFKKDLAKYLEFRTKEAYEGYVDDEFFNNDGKGFLGLFKKKDSTATTPKVKNPKLVSQGGEGTKVGNAIRSIATPENVQALINTGLGVLSDSLTAKADRKSIQDATALASERSKQAIADAQKEDASKSKLKAWIVPTIIGVVVLGGIVTFLVIRNKNK